MKKILKKIWSKIGLQKEAVLTETPHQYFQEGHRMSEVKTKFSKAQMIVRSKSNFANQDARTKVFRLSKSWQKWYEPKK